VANIQMEVGKIGGESVEVSSVVSPAQAGRIDLGRTIGEGEIRNLPLVSRNPYNFAFLQANVTGYENNEFGVPRINANGSQMHTNYQLDGNTNTEKDRAGLRMLPVSEVLVREVKVITNGSRRNSARPPAWSTTPSRRREQRAARLGQLPVPAQRHVGTAVLPGVHRAQAGHRGQRRDRDARRADRPRQAALLGAYEFVDRSLITGGQVITVTPANAERLGITLPESGVIPATSRSTSASARSITRSTAPTGSRRATSSSRTSPSRTSAAA
jgi:hypothetical protein